MPNELASDQFHQNEQSCLWHRLTIFVYKCHQSYLCKIGQFLHRLNHYHRDHDQHQKQQQQQQRSATAITVTTNTTTKTTTAAAETVMTAIPTIITYFGGK